MHWCTRSWQPGFCHVEGLGKTALRATRTLAWTTPLLPQWYSWGAVHHQTMETAETSKMLVMYLETFIIGHKFSWQIMILDKKWKTQQQKCKHKYPCHKQESKPDTCLMRQLKQLNVSTKVKLFNCFNVMGQNINKQSQHLSKTSFFCNILTCMDNYTGVQKFLYTIEIIEFFNTKDLISRQQTNLSR